VTGQCGVLDAIQDVSRIAESRDRLLIVVLAVPFVPLLVALAGLVALQDQPANGRRVIQDLPVECQLVLGAPRARSRRGGGVESVVDF
jgi:hypothetical protein